MKKIRGIRENGGGESEENIGSVNSLCKICRGYVGYQEWEFIYRMGWMRSSLKFVELSGTRVKIMLKCLQRGVLFIPFLPNKCGIWKWYFYDLSSIS